MLGDPLHQVLALTELVELWWHLHLSFEDANVLPGVVIRVLKHILVVFVTQIDFVARLERDIGTICHFVRLSMQLFVADGISEILRFGHIFRDVRDETHVLDVIVDEVVVL